MIEIEERLDIGAEEFFERIVVSVLYDIKNATGKKVGREQIYKGYKYKKRMKNKVGRSGDVDVKLSEYAPPLRYAAEFKTAGGVNRVSYEIERLEGSAIRVKYREDYDGNTKSQDLNYKIIGAFYKRKAKKRAVKMLHDMEEYIIQTRKTK